MSAAMPCHQGEWYSSAHMSSTRCRRYTLPLEEFYTNTPGGPNITAYQNGEPKAHKSFNCSIHCRGQQFCGAGNPGDQDPLSCTRWCMYWLLTTLFSSSPACMITAGHEG